MRLKSEDLKMVTFRCDQWYKAADALYGAAMYTYRPS